jgi:hypothetical protein|tara:strand:+ start:661 stop:837 length:177 start_codon:yes stop_codon:yes gene_type:complete
MNKQNLNAWEFSGLKEEKQQAIALILERVNNKDKPSNLTHHYLKQIIKETNKLIASDF